MKIGENQEFIENYLNDSLEILKKITLKDISSVIDILFQAWKNEKTVFVLGNGGSASTASHFTADLAKYAAMGTSYKKNRKRFKAICLNDNTPLISAWVNDFGFDSIFIEQVRPWLKKNDVVFAFSVHGGSTEKRSGKYSQNIAKVFAYAKSKGAILAGLTGDTGGIMKEMSDACIVIPTVNKKTITPQVEGIHLVIHHLIIHRLKELIEDWSGK